MDSNSKACSTPTRPPKTLGGSNPPPFVSIRVHSWLHCALRLNLNLNPTC